jgi:hypothetical protein
MHPRPAEPVAPADHPFGLPRVLNRINHQDAPLRVPGKRLGDQPARVDVRFEMPRRGHHVRDQKDPRIGLSQQPAQEPDHHGTIVRAQAVLPRRLLRPVQEQPADVHPHHGPPVAGREFQEPAPDGRRRLDRLETERDVDAAQVARRIKIRPEQILQGFEAPRIPRPGHRRSPDDRCGNRAAPGVNERAVRLRQKDKRDAVLQHDRLGHRH